jgi:hypothetical protein
MFDISAGSEPPKAAETLDSWPSFFDCVVTEKGVILLA